MCTYNTEHAAITGSGKGRDGWFALTDATVYYDHPVHAQAEHTLNIDFGNRRRPGDRVAVELTAASARELVAAIERALAAVPRRAALRRLSSPSPGWSRVEVMRAAYATALTPTPRWTAWSSVSVPSPRPRPGWTPSQVKAASLNHHDLWTLRGVGIKADQLPMILGCDAAGIDTATGAEVVRALGDQLRGLDRRRDPGPGPLAAEREAPGHAGRTGHGADRAT